MTSRQETKIPNFKKIVFKANSFLEISRTFDDDLLITGNTYSPKIDPFLPSFEIMTSRS